MTSTLYYIAKTLNITFDEIPVASKRGYIAETDVVISRYDTTGENPNIDSLGSYQDTGNNSAEVTIAGIVDNAKETPHDVRKRLRSFSLRDQQTNLFPFGAFGFELESFPESNITPSLTRGAIMQRLEMKHNAEKPTKIEFIATLRVLGDRGTSPDFSWSG